jgi:hypothetical protein
MLCTHLRHFTPEVVYSLNFFHVLKPSAFHEHNF